MLSNNGATLSVSNKDDNWSDELESKYEYSVQCYRGISLAVKGIITP